MSRGVGQSRPTSQGLQHHHRLRCCTWSTGEVHGICQWPGIISSGLAILPAGTRAQMWSGFQGSLFQKKGRSFTAGFRTSGAACGVCTHHSVSAQFKTTCLGPCMVCAGHQGIAPHEALYIIGLLPNISGKQLSCEVIQTGSAPAKTERVHLCQHWRRRRALGRGRRSLRLAGRGGRRRWRGLFALPGRCRRRRGALGGCPPHGGWRRLFWRRQLHNSWRHKVYRSTCSNFQAD